MAAMKGEDWAILISLGAMAFWSRNQGSDAPMFGGGIDSLWGGLGTANPPGSETFDPILTSDEDIGVEPAFTSTIPTAAPVQQATLAQQPASQPIIRADGLKTFGITNQPVAYPSLGPAATTANIGVVARAGYTVSGSRGSKPTVSVPVSTPAAVVGQIARGGFTVAMRNTSTAWEQDVRDATRAMTSQIRADTQFGAVRQAVVNATRALNQRDSRDRTPTASTPRKESIPGNQRPSNYGGYI